MRKEGARGVGLWIGARVRKEGASGGGCFFYLDGWGEREGITPQFFLPGKK